MLCVRKIMKDDRDWFDKGFDKTAESFRYFIKKGFAKAWFQWVEWVMLTAAMWAVAEKTGSVLVRVIAILSAAIVFFKAWHTMEQLADTLLPSPSTLPKWLVVVLSMLVALIPFFVIHFLAEVFGTIIA